MPDWSAYEAEALADLWAWRRAGPTAADRAIGLATAPLAKTYRLAMKAPVVRRRVEDGVEALSVFLSNWAGRVTPAEATDLTQADLEQLDAAAAPLGRRYRLLITAEGAAAGAAALAGPIAAMAALVADVPAVLGMSIRAVADYARTYGFDPNDPAEKAAIVQTVDLGTQVTESGKTAGLLAVQRALLDLSAGASTAQIERHAVVRLIRKTGERLGVTITQRKLGQLLPVLGAALGGGFNAYHAGKVTTTARQLYRARFLARKHGLSVDEVLQWRTE